MKVNEKQIGFWKPFLIWVVLFVFAQIAIGVTARTLIEYEILNVSDRVDPFKTSLVISTFGLILISFIGILAEKGKPFIYASALITSIFSMNPLGTANFYLLIFCLAVFLKWAFRKGRMIIGYYKSTES